MSNKAKDLLNNPEFKERLEMLMKGYIDKAYHDAGKKPPVPLSLIPLTYDDPKIQKGLIQLMQGAKNALYCYDQFVDKQ
ncbi:MAG: hypothetical protein RSA09_00100 [Acinetobacter sp.]